MARARAPGVDTFIEALTTCISRVDNGASLALCQNRENCCMPCAVAVAVAATSGKPPLSQRLGRGRMHGPTERARPFASRAGYASFVAAPYLLQRDIDLG
ncbi:hypothetical protein [Cupriavidus sp. 8B]